MGNRFSQPLVGMCRYVALSQRGLWLEYLDTGKGISIPTHLIYINEVDCDDIGTYIYCIKCSRKLAGYV